LVVLNDGSGTRLNNDGSKSSIDLTLVARSCSWIVLPYCFGSDHLIVSTTLDCIANQDNSIPPRWNFKKADWTGFSNDCDDSTSTQLLSSNINEACVKLTRALINSGEKNISLSVLAVLVTKLFPTETNKR